MLPVNPAPAGPVETSVCRMPTYPNDMSTYQLTVARNVGRCLRQLFGLSPSTCRPHQL